MKNKIFKTTICWVLILSFVLQTFPQPVQANVLDDIKTGLSTFIGNILSKINMPNEIKIADDKSTIIEVWTSNSKDPFLRLPLPFPYLNPFFGNFYLDQTTTIGVLPNLAIPEVCEVSVLPPPEENANFLTQEERLALNKSCYDLMTIKKAASSEAYYARQIFNQTDPLSECSIVHRCKSSCVLGFGSYSYMIHWLDIAEMVLPTGWMSMLAKIASFVAFVEKIKSYYDFYNLFAKSIPQFISDVAKTVDAMKTFANVIKELYEFKDDGGSFSALLEHYGKNLLDFSRAKSDGLIIISQTQKDGEELIKALQEEPGVRFLFSRDEQFATTTEIDGANSEEDRVKKRQELQKIIDDYLLAGFETPAQVVVKLTNIGKFLNDYLEKNAAKELTSKDKKGVPVVDYSGGEILLTGLICPSGAVSMDKNGVATTSQTGTGFCKFQGNFCPADWRPYLNWSTTKPSSCLKECHTSDFEGCGGCSTAKCTTNSHVWGNRSIEVCTGTGYDTHFYHLQCKSPAISCKAKATIIEIGCIPTGIVPVAYGICYKPTNNWFNYFKNFYLGIKKVNDIFQDFLTEFLAQNNPSVPSFSSAVFNSVTTSRTELLSAIENLPEIPNDFDNTKMEPQFFTTSSIEVGCPMDAELKIDDNSHYFCVNKVKCPSNAELMTDKNGQGFCKFSNNCPIGWKPYLNWSATKPSGIVSLPIAIDDCTEQGTVSWEKSGCSNIKKADEGCGFKEISSDGWHQWSEAGVERCSIKAKCDCVWGDKESEQKYVDSIITEIGCVPSVSGRTYAPFYPWYCDYKDDLAFMNWENMLTVITKEKKLGKIFNATQGFSSTSEQLSQELAQVNQITCGNSAVCENNKQSKINNINAKIKALSEKFNKFLIIEPFIAYQLEQQNKKLDAIKEKINKAIDEIDKANMEPAGSKEATIAVLKDLRDNKAEAIKTKFNEIATFAKKINDIWTKEQLSGTVTFLMLKEKYVKDILSTMQESLNIAASILQAEKIFIELETIGQCFLTDDITDCIKNMVPIPNTVVPMDASGNPTDQSNAVFYKWMGGVCPAGWIRYLNWSTTRKVNCGGDLGTSCCWHGCSGETNCNDSPYCHTGEHSSFMNLLTESITVKQEYCVDFPDCCEIRDKPCDATIIAIGCVLGDIKIPQSAKDILKEIFDPNTGSLNELKNFLLEDSETGGAAFKNIVGEYTCPDPVNPTGFLGKIKCFEIANTKTFKQILIFIEAMVKVVNVIARLNDIKNLIININPDRVLEKTFDRIKDDNIRENIDALGAALEKNPLLDFDPEFKNLTTVINQAKCLILDIYDMTRGGIPVDANGVVTTDASGAPVVTNNTVFYKFTTSDLGGCGTSACPEGWRPYLNWSATMAVKACVNCDNCNSDADYEKKETVGGGTWCGVRGQWITGECPSPIAISDTCGCSCAHSCITSAHTWSNSNPALEKCTAETYTCYNERTGFDDKLDDPCKKDANSTITAIGCVPNPDTAEYIKTGQAFFASSTAKVKERTEEMTKQLVDLEEQVDVVKIPLKEIMMVYYFLLGIKAFDVLADISISCKCCTNTKVSYPLTRPGEECNKKGGNSDRHKCYRDANGKRKEGEKVVIRSCGLSISFDQFKDLYEQAKKIKLYITCAIKFLKAALKKIGAIGKTVKGGDAEDGGGTEMTERPALPAGFQNQQITPPESLPPGTTYTDVTSENCQALLNTNRPVAKLADELADNAAGDNEWRGGFKIKEIARCVVNPARSIHKVDGNVIDQTGPKGGQVCGKIDTHFAAVESNFTNIRQTLQEIDLKRRNLGPADLFRITAGKIIPRLQAWLDNKGYGIKYKSVDQLYPKGEKIMKKARVVWSASTAINFAASNCTCGQSFCMFPVCISGLPLVLEAITNPFCWIVYSLRHPLLNAIKNLEEEVKLP